MKLETETCPTAYVSVKVRNIFVHICKTLRSSSQKVVLRRVCAALPLPGDTKNKVLVLKLFKSILCIPKRQSSNFLGQLFIALNLFLLWTINMLTQSIHKRDLSVSSIYGNMEWVTAVLRKRLKKKTISRVLQINSLARHLTRFILLKGMNGQGYCRPVAAKSSTFYPLLLWGCS